MSPCPHHPENAAAGACELCAQAHCAACLHLFLGRRYCPACLTRVQAIASPKKVGPSLASPSGPTTGPDAVPRSVAEDPGRAPRLRGWASALLYLVGFLVFIQLLAAPAALTPLLLAKALTGRASMAQPDLRELIDPGGLGYPVWIALLGVFTWGTFLATLLYTFGMGRSIERKTLVELGLTWPPRLGRDLLLGLGLAGILFTSIFGIGVAREWYVVRSVAPFGQSVSIFVVGFVLLLPYAAVEELALRGYLLQAARRSWGTTGAVIFSTLVFAFLHGSNPNFSQHPLALVGLVLAGLYLASAYLATGNLWLAIFLHTGWNLMEGPIFGLPVSGITMPASVFRTSVTGPDLWTGGAFGPEASLFLCILLVIHTATLWAVLSLVRRPTPADGTPRDSADTLYPGAPLPEN